MKKGYPWLVTLLMMVLVSGCKYPVGNRNEIHHLDFIEVLGVDIIKRGVRLTVASQKSGSGKTDGGTEGSTVNMMSAEGSTVHEAIMNFNLISSKMLYLGHLDCILLGNKFEKKNVVQYIDHLVRDHELRLNTKAVVVKNATAEEAMRKSDGSRFIGDALENFLRNWSRMYDSNEFELVNLIRTFDNPLLAAQLPCIALMAKNKSDCKKTEQTDLQMSGLAIFKNSKLLGYMGDPVARGMNWPKNKVRSGLQVVKDPKGKSVVLEIHDNTGKIIPQFKKDKLQSVTFDIKVSGSISEVMDTTDVLDKKTLEFLEKQQEAVIKKEIRQAICFAKQKNVDIFGISSVVEHQCPIKWGKKKIEKDNWMKTFPKLKIKPPIVESNISRRYNFK